MVYIEAQLCFPVGISIDGIKNRNNAPLFVWVDKSVDEFAQELNKIYEKTVFYTIK